MGKHLELTITIPDNATQKQNDFVREELQKKAEDLFTLLWPKHSYQTSVNIIDPTKRK